MTYERALQALADPTRRAILESLRHRSAAVGELADQLPVSQPAVSQHLRVLRDAQLVEQRREGTRHIYSLKGEGLAALRSYVESFWDGVLAAFEEADQRRGDDR